MRILWISPFAPYDTVGHGGGQNHNYYVKYLKKNTDFDITLLSVCESGEYHKLDLDKYNIKNIVKIYNRKAVISIIENSVGKFLLCRDGGLLDNRIYHLLLSAILEYKRTSDTPDVIITQWTEATLIFNTLHKFFPNSKYIAIEEDVAFLGYQRKYESATGLLKFYRKIRCGFLKKAEIETLKKYDTVVALNDKDKKLLIEEGIPSNKILRMCSFHGFYKNSRYNPDLHSLLFYGAMSRRENYLSAIWFIENVMDKLDCSYVLTIAGANPTEELLKYKSERIRITGFVDSIEPYFENSLCLVAPLLLGAGIKIKVLEALSAGLPVLTNDIGAEGISLTDGKNYMHCENSDDYLKSIRELTNNIELRERISKNGKEHVIKNFDADASLDILIGHIENYAK